MEAVGGRRVLDNDRLQVRMFPAKIVHQSLCCIAFAVVFFRCRLLSGSLYSRGVLPLITP